MSILKLLNDVSPAESSFFAGASTLSGAGAARGLPAPEALISPESSAPWALIAE